MKGVVVGRLRFREAGDVIDCAQMGVGGKIIPPDTDKVSDVTSDARFILLVEKDAAFMRLAEDRFYNRYPCIMLTAKGQARARGRGGRGLGRTLELRVGAAHEEGQRGPLRVGWGCPGGFAPRTKAMLTGTRGVTPL